MDMLVICLLTVYGICLVCGVALNIAIVIDVARNANRPAANGKSRR